MLVRPSRAYIFADYGVCVYGYLIGGQRHARLALNLPDDGIESAGGVAPMHRDLALQVRQPEGGDPVAAIGGADDREQRGVVSDRQQLAVAERPPLRREIEAEAADFANVGLSHLALLNSATGKCPAGR